ncbi:hypothetical protein GCM10009749_27280 [Agromyces neolithicus]|uniref:Uncharacterized protein n=1 Tax=Agromyces neolithicus TaxID=269420 RepID=A0ABN2M9G8_9MICO
MTSPSGTSHTRWWSRWIYDKRAEVASFIQDLDTRGLELAERIAAELRPAKVWYYSEGLLRYLP